MASNILKQIKDLCKLTEFKPSDNISRYFTGYFKDGVNLVPNIEMKNNSSVIFDEEEYNWISNIRIFLSKTTTSVSIRVISEGDEVIKVASSNKTVGKYSILEFDVSLLTKKVSLSLMPQDQTIELNGIYIDGYDFRKHIELISSIQESWDVLQEKESQELDYLDQEIMDKSSKLSSIEKQISSLSKEIKLRQESMSELDNSNKLANTQLESTRTYLENERKQLENVKNSIETLQKEKEEVNDRIEECRNELKIAIDDEKDQKSKLEEIRVELRRYMKKAETYSEDFSAFKSEITNQNRLYTAFLTIFSLSLILFVIYIYNSAISLVDNYQFNFDLWSLFVSKLPIISINIFVLGFFSTVIYQCINLIKQNFDKVSKLKQITYLVKECAESQTQDTGATIDDIIKIRIEKKMELIKEYLAFKNN